METNSSVYILFFTIIMAYIIFSVIANMMLFDKLGKKKWLAIIPFVNDYIMFTSFLSIKEFWIYILSSIIYLICDLSHNYNVLVSVLYLISLIVTSIIIVKLFDKIIQGFGANTLYSFGLILLYPVFMIYIMYKYELTDEMRNKLHVTNQ